MLKHLVYIVTTQLEWLICAANAIVAIRNYFLL